MVFNLTWLQPPTQPGKYQESKIKQFMLNGSCQSLGIKFKTVFVPNLNNLNSFLKAIIDYRKGKLKIQRISIQHRMQKHLLCFIWLQPTQFSTYIKRFKNIDSKRLFSKIPASRTNQAGYNSSCFIHCSLTLFNRTSNNPKWYND